MKKIKYTILVTGSSYGTQNASTAFLFCKSLVKTEHVLHSVFFYCDGVLNANSMNTPAIDEFNLTEAWQKLKKKYNVNLYVCISAALRRGVLENSQVLKNKQIKNGNLACLFKLSGLTELAKSIYICDRIIQF